MASTTPTIPTTGSCLGLKGTMSEFELCTMRNRLDRGKLNKATRGELFFKVPCGYVKLPSGEVALDPDEQARDVVRSIFDKFDELGTIYGVHRYLVSQWHPPGDAPPRMAPGAANWNGDGPRWRR